MNIDVGIINQGPDNIGTISRNNLRTLNEPVESEKIYSNRSTAMYGFLDLQSNRIGVVQDTNSYNRPLGTPHKKMVMVENYYELPYNDKTRVFFQENQKLPSESEYGYYAHGQQNN